MHPVLLEFGNIKIYSWGFMLAIAVIVAIIGLTKLFKREGYDPDSVLDLVILLVLAGIVGSRLLYIIAYQWQELLNDPAAVLSLKNGISGLVWYGSVLLDVPLFIWYLRRKKYPMWNVLDMFAPFVALGYAIVRIGCFLNGCCYGELTSSACGVVFPYVDSFTRYPTQLFSSGINFILFGILYWYYPRRSYDGEVFVFYFMGYSVYRFLIEFLRESQVNFGVFTMSQLISVGIFLLALLLHIWKKKQVARQQS
ncbi:MAG TPA: prolipoprotein diacylglyceryl transferase [Syntrophomonas sp.]|nr:prolipoprotein diacylglyceryl transferase [Syntrophomonas sp.]